MKKIIVGCLLLALLFNMPSAAPSLVPAPIPDCDSCLGDVVSPEEAESHAAGYRSGRGTYSGGARGRTAPAPAAGVQNGTNRTTTSPGTTTGQKRPATDNTQPVRTAPGTGWGRFFGGFALGSFFGGILNPFGFGGYGYGPSLGGGISIIGLLFWGVVLYGIYRLFRRFFGSGRL